MAQLLPIFPLDTVLLPGAPLPLHIFEPRYRELLSDVWGEGAGPGPRGFGIVALHRGNGGSGVNGPGRHRPPAAQAVAPELIGVDGGGGLRLAAIGTLAEIVEVEPYDDGRSDLLTIGARRFRLLEMVPDGKPYLQAQVDWLPEDQGEMSPGLVEVAQTRCATYLAALAKLAGRELPPIEFTDDRLALSYQVAGRMRLATSERQGLLEATTAATRLRATLHLLRRETMLLTRTRSVPVSPSALQIETPPN